jgi:hypothetical protein
MELIRKILIHSVKIQRYFNDYICGTYSNHYVIKCLYRIRTYTRGWILCFSIRCPAKCYGLQKLWGQCILVLCCGPRQRLTSKINFFLFLYFCFLNTRRQA